MLQGQKLQQAFDDYINRYSVEKGLMPKSITNKRDILYKLIIFLDGKPFTLESCRAYAHYLFDHGWNKPNSRLNIIKYLRAFVNFLYKYEYIEKNFAQELMKPKVPRREFDYVDPETVEKIIIAGTEYGVMDNERNRKIKDEMRVGLRFVLRTGLRINELITLKGSDLNLYDNPPTFWVISKGGNRELLPLPKDMLDELKGRINNNRLFRVTGVTCNDVLQRGAKKLGLSVKLTNHALRHIFASNLVKNRVPIQLVSRLMRHSSVEITDKTYTHLDVTDLSLVLNSNQTVVEKGLTPEQVFVNVEQAVRSTGVDKDRRFALKFKVDKGLLQIELLVKTAQGARV
jgi:integrase